MQRPELSFTAYEAEMLKDIPQEDDRITLSRESVEILGDALNEHIEKGIRLSRRCDQLEREKRKHKNLQHFWCAMFCFLAALTPLVLWLALSENSPAHRGWR